MISYEEFKSMNMGFGHGILDKEDNIMRQNYAIACEVEREYMKNFPNSDTPQPLDTVEFATDLCVYKHAMIVGDRYMRRPHLLTICENGSSWTDGATFSTSGGAFPHFHKSRFVPAGTDTCLVWTWGCHGAGANMGIKFPLNVQKWLIPYDNPTRRTRVTIYGKNGVDFYGRQRDAVVVESYIMYGNPTYFYRSFESIKAFNAWAEYVGFVHHPEKDTFHRVSAQTMLQKYILSRDDAPKNGKPLKWLHNGEVTDAWVVNDGDTITTYVLNKTERSSQLSEDDLAEYRKYHANPLGV